MTFRHSVQSCRRPARLLLPLFFLTLPFFSSGNGRAAQVRARAGQGIVELEADKQSKQGDLFIADGNVDIRFANMRLRADHIEYNGVTYEAVARGRVQFDFNNQHLDGGEAHYNVRSGQGTFRNVRGTVKIERRPNSNLLITQNPLYFEATEVERRDEHTYVIHNAWMTVCEAGKPKWKFHAPRAVVHLDKQVALIHANFRLFRVPLFYLPYATAPAGRNVRQSGLLLPDIGNTSRKGFVLGDSLYWAPARWMDTTLGAQFFSRRGWSQLGEFRARPWENVSVNYSYFGVVDRGLRGANGVRVPQGGHRQQFELQALLPNGWRGVMDINQLSSLTFRLAFAESFGEAVNAEVRSATFLTNNFHGFSLNFAALSDKNFLTIRPETSVVLRSAPEARFSSVEQAPWKRLPVYFGFSAFAGAVHRGDALLETATAVQRMEIAPRVTVPLHWGPWLGLTTTAAFRTTRYGSQLSNGALLGQSVRRNTGEFTADLRPPSLGRIFERGATRWKHTVEPDLAFRYVTGVHEFSRFIRFDQNDTLTNTREIEYGVTQRLFRKPGEGQAEEFLSWRVSQKHYFDPTFGGAIVEGRRNVFQALNSITPFAFADGRRRWSPVVSDLKVTPGGRYDAELIVNYDTERSKLTAIGTLVKVKPYREMFVSLAHFNLQGNPILQPRSNQIRALAGYGELNRRGFNVAGGFSYDVQQKFLQNQLVQVSYNGSCCGIAFEYRRLALGPVRTENQFRVAFIIANFGTFGNLRRQEKIF